MNCIVMHANEQKRYNMRKKKFIHTVETLVTQRQN